METVPAAWRYDGRRVVVTGCASGMGHALARELHALGAEVIGLDRNRTTAPVDAFVDVDLAAPDAIEAAVRTVAGPSAGLVDALFNCAGVSGGSGLSALDVFTINFLGTRHLTEALLPHMRDGGAIASIASLGGLGWDRNLATIQELLAIDDFESARNWTAGHPQLLEGGGYGFSKQCVIVYTMQRCVSLAARGIRINSTGPSPVESPMLAASRVALGDAYIDGFPKPLGRISNTLEQARVLAFLNSDAASYVTGQNLWTDGGYTAGMITGQIAKVTR